MGRSPFSLSKPVGSSPAHRQSFHITGFISHGPAPRPAPPPAPGRSPRPSGGRREEGALQEPPEGRAVEPGSEQPGQESGQGGWQVHRQGEQGPARCRGGGGQRGGPTLQELQREVQGEDRRGPRRRRRSAPAHQRQRQGGGGPQSQGAGPRPRREPARPPRQEQLSGEEEHRLSRTVEDPGIRQAAERPTSRHVHAEQITRRISWSPPRPGPQPDPPNSPPPSSHSPTGPGRRSGAPTFRVLFNLF